MSGTTLTNLIGFIAAIFTTVAFLPQAIKIIRTKDTKSISLFMYIILNAGIILWLIFGFLILELPVILANLVTVIFTLTILFFKIKHG
ncbi:MAG: SemiSWEET transporter [Bacteroidales bacterium]|nr:SemiSWEET transporter [Bacteroidales bacterium]